MADDLARISGEYHLLTGRNLLDLDIATLYSVGVALLARDVERGSPVLEAIDEVLDSSLGPPKEERTGGLLSYDPDLEIPGWGSAPMPDLAMVQGPASARPPTTIEADADAVPDK